ncbi:MAG: TonB-dependent receptor [Muribaculaceae bacterium]
MKRFLFLMFVWFYALSLYAVQDVFVVNGTEVKDFTGQELVGKTVKKYRIETTADSVIHYIDFVENEKIVVVDALLNMRDSGGTGKLNKPMVVIDGKIATQETLGKLKPWEISNITVLKNEAAVKVYGPEASDGVILVVTKAASKQKE